MNDDIVTETITRLSPEAFDEFSQTLDIGMPLEAQELLKSKPVWED